jgi:catechol 2,3-dioxygenase-like lactoylglutathione lyase family enzyme
VLDHFDHITIAVRSLDSASETYQRLLGVAPVWRGGHPELGTQAALFALSNSLVELVAPRADAEEAAGMRALLDAKGEGLQALAFGTQDAAALSAALRGKGMRATPAQDGEAHSDGGGTRSYRTVELAPRATRGLSVFAVERSDLTALHGAAIEPAADCVGALDHIVVRTADPDAAIALYRDGLGIRLALDRMLGERRMLFFRVGGVTLEVVSDPSLAADDALYGVAYRVRDIDAARARLHAHGLSVSDVRAGNKPGTRVFTVRDGTCGVPTLILFDPARDT